MTTNGKEAVWDADVPNDDASSRDGSSSGTTPPSPDLSPDSPHRTMLRLAIALEKQNEVMWALVEQTATLIGIVAEGQIEDEEAATTYLDGTRM